jgi:hypothetical protein
MKAIKYEFNPFINIYYYCCIKIWGTEKAKA